MRSLEVGFQLDERWHLLRREMERSKRPDLVLLARVLGEAGCAYAIIGGVALQVHQDEPRTTLDVDVAVKQRDHLPRGALATAGFTETGRFEHTDNWIAPGGTVVQITDDPALREAIDRAIDVPLDDAVLRVLTARDLFHEKLRAGRDPARRRSKRLQDVADAQALLEQRPELEAELSPEERALLERPA
jgi:hypothetical protein